MIARLALLLLLVTARAAVAGGPIQPPPPQPAADCAAGATITGYPFPGAKLGAGGHCGTPVASGTINLDTVGRLGIYTGTGTISGLAGSPNAVLTANSSSTPAWSTTLPSGLTIPGYLTGNQTITLSGDVLGSGTTAIPTALAAGAAIANLGFTPVPNTRSILTSPPLSGGGDLTADRTFILSGPSQLTTFPAGVIPKGAGASPFSSSSIVDGGSGIVVGGAVGGTFGNGTINATGLYINGVAVGSGGGGGGGGSPPGAPIGSLQTNLNGTSFGGLVIGQAFSTNGGTFSLASSAACFNLGPWTGDLTGAACAPPTLSVGAAANNLGPAGGGLTGSFPAPSLNPTAVIAAMGVPSGDLGGPSYSAPLVLKLNGFQLDTATPTSGASFVWNGSKYALQAISPGVNQGTGDVVFGPGAGSQVTTIAPGVVTNQKLANMAAMTMKCNAGTGFSTPQDCPATGGLLFAGGALQIDPTIGVNKSLAVGTNCWNIANGFVVSITLGACTGGQELTADNATTVLTADDALTHLTADGSSPGTPCGAMTGDMSDSCNVPEFLIASGFGK